MFDYDYVISDKEWEIWSEMIKTKYNQKWSEAGNMLRNDEQRGSANVVWFPDWLTDWLTSANAPLIAFVQQPVNVIRSNQIWLDMIRYDKTREL